jgi:hypothetical protein
MSWNTSHRSAAAAFLLTAFALGASATAQSPAFGADASAARPDQAAPGGEPDSPLPLRTPIRAVMAGIIDFSSHGVFLAAMAEGTLNENDWLATGLAALNLVGAATLITTAGAGPNDSSWVADPDWRQFAFDMQASSINVGIAVRQKNRAALLAAADRLARSCQSCHDQFRHDQPPGEATRLASAKP